MTLADLFMKVRGYDVVMIADNRSDVIGPRDVLAKMLKPSILGKKVAFIRADHDGMLVVELLAEQEDQR